MAISSWYNIPLEFCSMRNCCSIHVFLPSRYSQIYTWFFVWWKFCISYCSIIRKWKFPCTIFAMWLCWAVRIFKLRNIKMGSICTNENYIPAIWYYCTTAPTTNHLHPPLDSIGVCLIECPESPNTTDTLLSLLPRVEDLARRLKPKLLQDPFLDEQGQSYCYEVLTRWGSLCCLFVCVVCVVHRTMIQQCVYTECFLQL